MLLVLIEEMISNRNNMRQESLYREEETVN
jgi:hypothetical protein